MEGRTIGHWKLGTKLGEGSFGAVYEAENTVVAGRRAAVKVLHPDRAESEDVRRRFINEASAASRADHENIIQVFDGGTTDEGQCYLVIELLRGSTLSELCAAGQVETVRALRIGVQIARALAAAHRAGIVHRDLKPDNVFLTQRDTERDFVKVLDFGVAQLKFARSTMVGIAIGTPAYMSPEQWEAKGEVDGRADIYALGLMLYELLAGRRPFEVAGDYAWLHAHTSTPPPLPPLDEVPPEVRALVLHLLAKRREQRPQTMDEVVRSLEAALALLQPAETFTIRPPDATVPGSDAPTAGRWLVVVQSAGGRREVPVPRSGEVTIGSRKGNVLRLDAQGVAPWHARLVRVGGHFFVEERERGKGLLRNGRQVEWRAPVAPGDVLQVGDFELRLVAAGDGRAPPERRGLLRLVGAVLATALLLAGGTFAVLRMRSELRAREDTAQVARLNVAADRALKARDWDAAIARADEGLKIVFGDETLRDKRTLAMAERAARAPFDAFLAAARARDFDRALESWKAIPAASSYRRDAQSSFSEVLAGYVEAHVMKAHGLQESGRCAEALLEVAAVLALDDSNVPAQELARSCAAPPPPPPEPAAPPAGKVRGKGSPLPARRAAQPAQPAY